MYIVKMNVKKVVIKHKKVEKKKASLSILRKRKQLGTLFANSIEQNV